MNRPGEQRELVFCHHCENEWYRDEHGLVCPGCQSEFTEIIEPSHDPRAEQFPAGYEEEDEDHADRPASPFAHHNPWANAPDPEEGDINHFEWRSNGPGSFTVSGTVYRSVNIPSQGRPQPPIFDYPLFQNFATMLQGIAGENMRTAGQQRPPDPGSNHRRSSSVPGRGADGLRNGFRVESTGGVPRFNYTSTARLYPRDANHPQPRFEPVDDLHNVLGRLFNVPGGLNDPSGQHDHPRAGEGVPPNPLAALLAFLNPAAAAHGDVVYTEEALDRVMTQLMEQNISGNAPGPASQEAIAALPKKLVEINMLDDKGKAECSICMDEVIVGEKVTCLPCTHWFHGACIEAWLREHDTCPHCRKGIMPRPDSGTNSNAPANGEDNESRRSTLQYAYQPPGAWVGGSATQGSLSGPRNRDSPSRDGRPRRPERHPSSGAQSRTSGNTGGSSSEGGIGGTLRNLFRSGRSSDRSAS